MKRSIRNNIHNIAIIIATHIALICTTANAKADDSIVNPNLLVEVGVGGGQRLKEDGSQSSGVMGLGRLGLGVNAESPYVGMGVNAIAQIGGLGSYGFGAQTEVFFPYLVYSSLQAGITKRPGYGPVVHMGISAMNLIGFEWQRNIRDGQNAGFIKVCLPWKVVIAIASNWGS